MSLYSNVICCLCFPSMTIKWFPAYPLTCHMSSHTGSGHYLGISAEFVGIAYFQQQFSLSGLTESSLASSQPLICTATLLIVRKVRRLFSVLTPSVNMYCYGIAHLLDDNLVFTSCWIKEQTQEENKASHLCSQLIIDTVRHPQQWLMMWACLCPRWNADISYM